MALFCLECTNKDLIECYGVTLRKKDVVLTDFICEGCAEWKPCVVDLKGMRVFFGKIKYGHIIPYLERRERRKRKKHHNR